MRWIFGAICVYFLVLIVLRYLWLAREAVVVIILGTLIGMTLARGVDVFEKIHIPRYLGAPLLMLLLIAAIIGIIVLVEPTIAGQVQQLRQQLPTVVSNLENNIDQRFFPGHPGELQQKLNAQFGTLSKMLFPFLENSIAAMAGLVVVLFLAIYVSAQAGLYRAGLIHLIPPAARPRAIPVVDGLGHVLQRWVFARLMAMTIIGVAKGVGCWALGVPAPIALGLIAFTLTSIPFFGPILAGIPAVLMALVISPVKALEVVGLAILLHELEGHIVGPLLMRNRLNIPPVLTVFAITTLAIVLGLPGMLIAEPLAATVIYLVRHLYVDRIEGRDLAAVGTVRGG